MPQNTDGTRQQQQDPEEGQASVDEIPVKLGGGVSLVGFRLLLASDDFYVPSVICSIGRFMLVAFYAGIYTYSAIAYSPPGPGYDYPDAASSNNNSNSSSVFPCLYDHGLIEFMIGTIVTLSINILISLILGYNSRRGVIWQGSRQLYNGSHPRRWVVPLLHLSLIGFLAEIGVLIYGTYCLVTVYWDMQCNTELNYPVFIITGAVSLEYLGVLTIVAFFWILTKDKCCPAVFRKGRNDGDASRGLFFTLLGSICFRKTKVSHFHDAVDLLDDVFLDDNFVPTDIMAALILIYTHEEVITFRRKELFRGATDNNSNTERRIEAHRVTPKYYQRFQDEPEWQHQNFLLRFMQYSAAIYGYKMFIVDGKHPWARVRELNKHTVCCSVGCCCLPCIQKPDMSDFVSDDNCCYCDFAAIKATLPFLSVDDIVYASFQNDFLETPFLVAIDRMTSSVVVAVRGTLSFTDVITDLVAKPREIAEAVPSFDQINGEDQVRLLEMTCGFSCHSGMMEAALYVYRQLQIKHLLEKAFARCPDFNLVITGHSLGAGTATVLAFLLRPKYPNLKCYSYGPPGGLLSAKAAETSREFCVSVIVGADIVPRTTIKAVHNLRGRMVEVLRNSHIPKYNIISHGLIGRCCGSKREWMRRIEADFVGNQRRESSRSTEPILINEGEDYGATADNNTCQSGRYPEMYPPGEIIHFEKSYSDDKGEELVNVHKKKPSDFENIVVSPNMISDHMPASYIKSLEFYLHASK